MKLEPLNPEPMSSSTGFKETNMKSSLKPDRELRNWIRDIRRHIHRHPELGFQEYNTSMHIRQKLQELHIPFHFEIAGTGIIATLGDEDPSAPCIALRADMDGLPIEEKTGLSFSSKNPGVMHACGHDGHVAMLLGAAALLKKQSIPGRVVFIFQPAEEGEGGARTMISQGALKGVDAIFGGHIDRHFEVGRIAVEPGLICAYTDSFHIKISGKGGHAAKPHETVDIIVVASLLVMSIQTLVSREINPAFPTVVTVGRIRAGSAANVIAEHAVLEGTIRATHPQARKKIIAGLTRMVKAMEDLYHAETYVEFTKGYPPVINDPTAVDIARDAASTVVNDSGVMGLPYPSLGGEDFSYYLEHVPGCFVRFGAMKKGFENAPAHSPFFDFDEKALPVGAAFLAKVALTALDRIDEIRAVKK